ncbi:MAG: DUF86 domain-containing protein [Anaerolineaceae bacterium]|nr:DUF86 domain-containing protein [Anaerolineaceae bacterium]
MSEIEDYLHDILIHLNYVEQFTSEGKNAFLQDEKTQFAVMRAYEIIGEIVKRLPASLLLTQPQMNWQTLRRFRDFLAHNYGDIDLVTIWAAVEDLPNLRAAVEAMLAELDDAGDEAHE